MAGMSKIKNQYSGKICRRCINEKFGVELNPEDCVYESMYLYECHYCKQPKHIVSGLRASGKMKMMFK